MESPSHFRGRKIVLWIKFIQHTMKSTCNSRDYLGGHRKKKRDTLLLGYCLTFEILLRYLEKSFTWHQCSRPALHLAMNNNCYTSHCMKPNGGYSRTLNTLIPWCYAEVNFFSFHSDYGIKWSNSEKQKKLREYIIWNKWLGMTKPQWSLTWRPKSSSGGCVKERD